MAADHRAALREIKSFPQLVAYLRDVMNWPIERLEIDELTFDYSPEELDIDPKNAAHIQEIKRLRPLTVNQPWGIFFIKFAPSRLPVVALRRILRKVVLQKRAKGKDAERSRWAADDLLFISNYGEGDARQINFAHFSQSEAKVDRLTLKVLYWDDLRTPFHLDAVAKELTEHLSWPDDETNVDEWRRQWRAAFSLGHRQVITTAKQLSIALAELARAIRGHIKDALDIETRNGRLTKLMKAFQEALVHELDATGFADMVAQTITYGLLSARLADPRKKTVDDFASHMRTNPFLRELMETFLDVGGRPRKGGGAGIDFDELGVTEVVELLDDPNTHMDAVFRDFGDRNPQDDPVIRFYEDFFTEYDGKEKKRLGVFYTPRPVVSYIVRSVHELLQTEFGLADGLADTTTWGEMLKKHPGLKLPLLSDQPNESRTISPDEPFVQILDPATGTATFLVEVVDLIQRTLKGKWKQQGLSDALQHDAWNDYVPKHLLPRLHAFELMMAPYAIAHMKIGLKLAETGYRFATEERARIYLTNALEPSQEQLKLPEFDALAHEAVDVNEIKQHKRFTVVIGNPPYSTSISEPQWLMRRLEDWKQGLNETKSDLTREEWKFLRLAQHLCMVAGAGIVGFIINRDFLDGIAKRRMREHLGQSFPLRIAVDLNGDVKGNIADENVFEIEQGVAITVLSTICAKPGLRFSSRVGTQAQKYADLDAKKPIDAALTEVKTSAPYFRWVPFSSAGGEDTADEYAQWMPLETVFTLKSSGVQTKNDQLCIGWTANEIFERVERLAKLSLKEASAEFGLNEDGVWSLTKAQGDLQQFGISRQNVRRILYRPLDVRFTYYTHKSSGFLGRPRYDLMRHMLDGRNIGLIFNRQIVGDNVSHFSVSRDLTCHGTFYLGNKGQDYLAPLYLHHFDDLLNKGDDSVTPNFTPAFTAALRGKFASSTKLTPEEIFHYAYGVFHSPSYRQRYAEFLKIDFPRLPLTESLELFRALARLGGELTSLHLLESPTLKQHLTRYFGNRDTVVEKVLWSNSKVWVDKAKTAGFGGVSEGVWNFHIGGYQVCEKWLKDRKGRTLSDDDIAHYQKIVVAISETIRLMKEIDEVIEQHGGWPGAFQTASAPVAVAATTAPRLRIVEDPSEEERYRTCVPLVPLKAAATNLDQEPQFIVDNQWEWVAVDTKRRLRPGMFVAEVEGRSMEPAIPDGSFCLFDSSVEGSRQGKTVLVKLHRGLDPESGANYTIKRYESEKVPDGESWRHERITLKPNNPDFAPLVFTEAPEEEFAVIAEFVEVISPSHDESQAPVNAKGDKSEQSAFSAERTEARPASRREQRPKATPTGQGSLLDSVASSPAPAVRAQAPERAPEPPERDELICVIRQLLTTGGPRDRETALQELKEAIGYQRLGTRIRETLDNALRTAVRRGIVTNEADTLSLQTRSIEDYDRDFLKEQFLASLEGRTWRDREDAIRDFARWLGFRRTGPNIDDTARSLINGLIREGRLESEASSIRRSG